MKASEALKLTNSALDLQQKERRPSIEETMQSIYKEIERCAKLGLYYCYVRNIETPSPSVINDIIEELGRNGYAPEVVYGSDLSCLNYIRIYW